MTTRHSTSTPDTAPPSGQHAPPDGWQLDAFIAAIDEAMTELGIASTRPDRRTVRYYATLGVLDKPTTSGREVRYHDRHLNQLLALKRLQSAGLRLGAIESRIADRSDDELRMIAAASDPVSTPATGQPSRDVQHQFWARPAVTPTGSPQVFPGHAPGHVTVPAPGPPPAAAPEPAVELTTGVRLVFPGADDVSATEAALLRSAARAVIDQLAALGLPKED